MADVTLRFHGRFLYVQKTNPKTLTVVAPVFGQGFDPHQPLMSIRHDQVLFKANDNQTVLTTFQPSFRILSDTASKDPQVMVWDLTGCRVTYVTESGPPNGGLTPLGAEVASLKDLEANENRTAVLRPDSLVVGRGYANAIIEVTTDGKSSAAEVIDYSYSHEDKAKNGRPEAVKKNGTQDPLIKKPAEIVEFKVALPNPPGSEKPRLTLQFEKGGAVVGVVCVQSTGTVCFSHSCPKIQELPTTDLEFGRYYDALTHHDPKALIPFDEQGLIEGIPCYQTSQMSF